MSRRKRWVGYIADVGRWECVHNVVGKSEGKKKKA
jgi:hypothetical protein